MDLCTCNNTSSNRLRMVRGNDFATLYTINATYADETPVPNWDITQCTDVSIKVHRSVVGGVSTTKEISAYGSYRFANTNVLIIDWDGLLMKVGTYSVDFAAKFDGVDIRWYSKQEMVFDIVESNEEANIPEDSFIEDGIYRLDGDFVLMFGVQQQADWDEEDPTHPAYIKNRPEGVDLRDYLKKTEAALTYLAKVDAHIPEHGGLNTLTNAIDFYDEDDVLLFSVDATAMLKDSRIDDITYSNGYMTFNFNADAEKSPISIYIGDVFNSGNYYDKTASDLRFVSASTLLDYYTAAEVNTLLGAINTSISTINGKIPSEASSSNQLADKAFVNSSVSTATATFRGTSATGLTESQFITWANSLTHDLNDYVYWNTTDTAGNTVYKRYKYNGSSWVYEYDLNNSSFTSSEWAAIQSGITSSLVTKLSDLPTNSQLTTALGNKQDTIGDLSDIRSGAQAGSTAYQLPSGGVPDTDIASASTWNGKQDALVSGTNIKTVNNQSLLGSGNITIEGGGEENVIDSISVNGSALTPDADKNVDITIPVTDVTVGGSSVLSSGTAVIPAIPTVPTISTDISADATSDTKTASPKAVKTYADSVAGQSNVIEAITMNGNAVTITNKTAAIVESDPVFTASAAYGISSSDITKWNAAAVVADDDGTASIASFDPEADTVWHKAQTLSAAQKSQARTNIGAQETLVSGTNIKTINGSSVLGSGNLSTLMPVTNHGTSDTTFAVTPNILHIWGTVASLTLTLATPTDATIVNEYMIEFTSGSTATTLSLPSSVEWAESCGSLSVEASKTYQISIVNNIGLWASISNS